MTAESLRPLRFAFGGMIALAVAMGFGRFVYTPILPGMMDELGLSAADAGLIAAANYLGYLVGAVVAAGGWAHRHERNVMLAALFASAALSAVMGLTDSLWLFLATRFLAGVASAFVMVFLTTIVFSHLAASRRNDLQAMHFGGVGLGIAVSSAMMAALIQAEAAWPAGWLWSAVLSAAGFLVALVLVDEGPLGNGSEHREPKLPKSLPLAKVILAYGMFGLGYVVTATFLVAIVRQSEAGRLFEAIVWLVTGAAAVPSVWLWNKMAARRGLTVTFAVGCAVEAVGVAASVSVGGYWGPLLGGLLLGGTFVAVTAIGLRASQVLAPLAPRRALALMTAAFGLGQILGPIIAGYAAEWSGSFTAPSIGAAICLLLAASIAWSAGPAPKSP
ncbi:YbfB/YjiJ family MFS transporter [Pseudaminobacter arsenicus]|uniref:YbfB/YjiJ family MFS transporter n=1 Tax=Borborobacter arsenicus TaxID=1851146 RepID=A0A432V552_9HYPH|nr:YbfB/YjiJ family MFS transporter [Pseudaminobacter arsenicus]RUM97279.1 YbfB/YjiJ family MFS transporter [Pseudaminobacter arsenicus]